uniref:Synaptotagmin-8 n=1 Tax=Cryptocotyle lingua TaxID=66766 RepID=A0A7U0TIC2_9TREM|nr:synaptotagmin-8 [Cryptocotyle lingua]
MNSTVNLRNKDSALSRLATQYDNLEMWIHNYLPDGDVTAEEKEHIRSVMQKDQELKKADAGRLCRLTGTFPSKLRPELLMTVVEDLRMKNPAVPGSGLVSLCAPIALDRLPKPPTGLPNTNTTRPLSLGSLGSTEISLPLLNPKQKSKANWDNTGQCPFCYRAFSLIRKACMCIQCYRQACSRCGMQVEKTVFLCKDCLELARVLCKTGDWFAQYLTEKPATPLKIGVDVNNAQARSRRMSRFKPQTLGELNPETSKSANDTKLPKLSPKSPAATSPMNGNAVAPRPSRRERSDERHAIHFRLDEEAIDDVQPAPTAKEAARLKRYTYHSTLDVASKDENVVQKTQESGRSRSHEHLHVDEKTDETRTRKKSHGRDVKKAFKRLSKHRSPEKSDGELANETHAEIGGEVEFSMEYDATNSRLTIMVYEARNLIISDKQTGKSNICIKVFLKPHLQNSTVRKIVGKGQPGSPQFNEAICYSLAPTEMARHRVVMEVWQKRSHNSSIFHGQVSIPLKDHKWDDSSRKRRPLSAKPSILSDNEQSIYIGEIKIALKFALREEHRVLSRIQNGQIMLEGDLEVRLVEAKNLLSESVGTNITAFAKASLVSENRELESQTTESMSKTNNPKWNTVVRFKDLIQRDLMELALEVSVWHRGVGKKQGQLLGGIRLGVQSANPDGQKKAWKTCTTEEKALWTDCIRKPDQWVSATLPLHELCY